RRDLRVSQSRQIGPDQAVLLRHARNPRVPLCARFVIAVYEHGRLGLAPRLSKPVLAIEQILFVVLRNTLNRHALRKRAGRGAFAGDRRDGQRRRGSATGVQQISTRHPEAHLDTPFWPLAISTSRLRRRADQNFIARSKRKATAKERHASSFRPF